MDSKHILPPCAETYTEIAIEDQKERSSEVQRAVGVPSLSQFHCDVPQPQTARRLACLLAWWRYEDPVILSTVFVYTAGAARTIVLPLRWGLAALKFIRLSSLCTSTYGQLSYSEAPPALTLQLTGGLMAGSLLQSPQLQRYRRHPFR